MRRRFTELLEAIYIAARAVRVHKMRSILTTLGIVIGILSVTAMATVVNGLEGEFDKDMEELGTDVLYVEKWPWTPTTDWWNYINRPNITPDIAEAIEARSRYAVGVVPSTSTRRTVSYEANRVYDIQVVGVTSNYPSVHKLPLDAGHFFSQMDDRSARPVAVIGATIAQELFPVGNPLGKTVRIGGKRFKVIGVVEKKGRGADAPGSDDHEIKVPLGAFAAAFGSARRDYSVRVKVRSPEHVPAAKDEITGIVRLVRGLDATAEDDFEVNEQQTLRAKLAPIKRVIYTIGIGLTTLSLLVGGIGVMNIMFVSVKERTREIGLRKAVGARPSTIMMQFLIESVLVCLIGGLLGLLLAIPVAALIRLVLPATVNIATLSIAFLICVATGIIFGIAPAWTAARSTPIDALRYE